MQEGMLHRIQFPGKYLQGVNALAELPKLITQYGSRGLVLASPSAKRILTGAGALPELAELPIVGFGGECCEKEIASLRPPSPCTTPTCSWAWAAARPSTPQNRCRPRGHPGDHRADHRLD
jgi:hypothetical protein